MNSNNIIIHIIACFFICICIIIIFLSQNYSILKRRKIHYNINKQHQHFGLSLLYENIVMSINDDDDGDNNNNDVDIAGENFNNNNNNNGIYYQNDNFFLEKKLIKFYHDDNNDEDNDDEFINNDFSKENNNGINNTFNKNERNDKIIFFSKCNDDTSPNCVTIKNTIYDKQNHKILLDPKYYQHKYILPYIDKIPTTTKISGNKSLGYCGFGILTFDKDNEQDTPWECSCHAPEYLGGEMCDEPQTKLIQVNKCSKIAHVSNLKNFDVATFNPFVEGVCVQCVDPELGYIPVVDSIIPMCTKINIDAEEEEEEEESKILLKEKDACFYDALNPHLYNSPFNKYVEGYGCVCDYYNGFVEVFLPDIDKKNEEISNACIKIGKRKNPEEYHRTDLAFYCLQNNLYPIQIHSYENLEQPFSSIFPGITELLIKQQSISQCNENDWLNRHIKPSRQQPLYRLKHPEDTWPIVHKRHLVNQYTRRNETYPISAYKLSTGRGFETKHWYETTSDRYMSNSIWSHPIIYTHHPGTKWTNKTTLNPLGPQSKQYYGLTLNTKPGEIVRLDTRGYNQEDNKGYNEKENNLNVITLPPDYKTEMMDPTSIIYMSLLYNNYKVTN